MKFYRAACGAGVILMSSVSMGQSVIIALSYVGNPNNAADRSGYGEAPYDYQIGKFDVTEEQYTAFLNAVAQHDPYKLYTREMLTAGNELSHSTDASDPTFRPDAGIMRTQGDNGYTYSVIGTSGSYPATHISWFDAARFCNWMHNGQPRGTGEIVGSTETGAYMLNGDTSEGTERREPGAKWWIPSENEWYKAAYYDPRLNNGTGGYWLYPTRSNNAPNNIVGGGVNEANCIVNGRFCVNVGPVADNSHLTPVGSFPNSHSYYGTFDQGGDVLQWNDASFQEIFRISPRKLRGVRGGCANSFAESMQSSARGGDSPSSKVGLLGFRVATVP